MLLTATFFAACTNINTSETKKDAAVEVSNVDTSKMITTAKYTCTMHPEVITDTPGQCPKCEMNLVQVNDSTNN